MQHYLLQFVDKGFHIVCDSGVSWSYLLVFVFDLACAHTTLLEIARHGSYAAFVGEDHDKLSTYIMVTQSS